MSTYTDRVRQGLPRVAGGQAWPAAGVSAGLASATEANSAVDQAASNTEAVATPVAAVPAAAAVAAEAVATTEAALPAGNAPVASSGPVLRQGLPRVPGGAPWPAGGAGASTTAAQAEAGSVSATSAPATSVPATSVPAASVEATAASATAQAVSSVESPESAASDTPLRRGLPRVAGGEAWPAAGFAPAGTAVAPVPVAQVPAVPAVVPALAEAPAPVLPQDAGSNAATTPASTLTPISTPAPAPVPERASAPALTKAPERAPAPVKKPREPIMIGARPLAQWVKFAVLGGLGAIVAAGIIVLAARGVTTLPGVPAWQERYPGEYELPESSVDGFPAWARWGHFFNLFLMVLIIRSGLLVRNQQKPPAFWTSKRGGWKVSINFWLHTSLDVLWVINGLIFVVLLFVTGHWMRIIPTSWEVFPNALSAMLQYLTLDWPVEDGWVNYNALQQLMYFLVVFIASPIAIISGVRMSGWWPQDTAKLNRVYPAQLARAIHFPTMLFFVLFIIVHVFLVFTTGALKNLNHMFTGTPTVSWTGFWLFALAIAVTAGGWFACKPLVVAPIASLFGKVSNR